MAINNFFDANREQFLTSEVLAMNFRTRLR